MELERDHPLMKEHRKQAKIPENKELHSLIVSIDYLKSNASTAITMVPIQEEFRQHCDALTELVRKAAGF